MNMNIKVVTVLVGIGFLMNGCLLDKIRQRVNYLQMRNSNDKQRLSASEREELRQSGETKKRDLYMPSKAEPIEEIEEVEEVALEKPKKSKPKIKKSKSRVKSKSSKPKAKHKRREVKKIKPKLEPYSIESEQGDPELLGPQTTLESNPLKKTGDKI